MATKVEKPAYTAPRFTSRVWLPPMRASKLDQINLCKDKDDRMIVLNAGAYLVEAGPASGKTLLLYEFALRADVLNTKTAYIYTGEARSDIERGAPFFDPKNLHTDAVALLNSPEKPSLMIVDSVTLAIKAFDDGTRADATTFSQGMQITDIAFIYELNSLAAKKGVALLLALNSSLIRFSEWLHGACEGSIKPLPNSEGAFTVTDRGGRRNRPARQATIYNIGPCSLAARALEIETKAKKGSGFTQA